MPEPTQSTSSPVHIMKLLATLAEVRKSLTFLADVGVIEERSIVKGCTKFTKDHPEIQEWFNKNFHEANR